jgi:hypothetical protein
MFHLIKVKKVNRNVIKSERAVKCHWKISNFKFQISKDRVIIAASIRKC